jgi:hypothetical protein
MRLAGCLWLWLWLLLLLLPVAAPEAAEDAEVATPAAAPAATEGEAELGSLSQWDIVPNRQHRWKLNGAMEEEDSVHRPEADKSYGERGEAQALSGF